MGRTRIAIVGTGGIAHAHADGLSGLAERAELVAAVDVDQGRLDEFAERWGIENRYTDLATALREAAPDLVHLCTPPGAHHQQAIACLSAGVPVLCEKPPTLSLAELDDILAAERAGGARFATVFQHRFGSAALRLRRLVEAGDLGRPLVAVCHTLWYRPDEYFAVPWRGNWEIEGGGPTMGHGIHQMDLLLSVLGEWAEVTAVADRKARPTATEDVSCALVRFENGAVATVVNSLLSPRETSYLRFDLEHATVEVEHLYGYQDQDWRVTPAPGREAEVRAAWDTGDEDVASGHRAQFDALLTAHEGGLPLPVSAADSRSTLELVAAIYASSFTGTPVRRGEITDGHPFHGRMSGGAVPWPAP
ncbi:gfo/Idh/MocA family oxidoreductase [Actinoalloteichus sp. AHMU CJ021]|uniref:Dehydrogenase n=2 Tax=Actinoalloteichus cyanogriseus TaxID=2893586 RepID=A0ABT1JL60_ACTCY|nr:Gfo/Idh/MocA family oxidoreductase [Actinoalloteichus caeruleus]AUS79016.1 gfo/Idh/MocA family oxidoreductase [Actinoalloteichus sp. AHMU CJ021]MCP2333247.1 putative dehydrogenase [Actinoalloteichus caeruleus DSM 43889]